MYYQNAHSILGKLATLKTNIVQLSYTPDIIIITETWLQSEVHSSELGLSNYNVFRKDRDLAALGVSKGGGVLVAINKQISAQDITPESSLEQLFIKINFSNNNKFILCANYFQPNSSEQLFNDHARFIEEMHTKHKEYEFIFAGDYNLPNIRWSSDPLHYIKTSYIEPLI